MASTEKTGEWGEAQSEAYRALADYAVPERERQIALVTALVKASAAVGDVVEICCGEGILTQALLAALPAGRVLAFDGSPSMLEASRKLCGDDERLETRLIDIFHRDWRRFAQPLRAVISSLAVHHLDDAGKRELFADMHAALAPGGVLVLADVIRPATRVGHDIAARMWDEEVERRSIDRAGDRSGLETFIAADWNHFRHEVLDPIDKPSTLAEHFDWFRQAGFADVDLHWMQAGQMVMSAWKG